jgi:hypothetical protein
LSNSANVFPVSARCFIKEAGNQSAASDLNGKQRRSA